MAWRTTFAALTIQILPVAARLNNNLSLIHPGFKETSRIIWNLFLFQMILTLAFKRMALNMPHPLLHSVGSYLTPTPASSILQAPIFQVQPHSYYGNTRSRFSCFVLPYSPLSSGNSEFLVIPTSNCCISLKTQDSKFYRTLRKCRPSGVESPSSPVGPKPRPNRRRPRMTRNLKRARGEKVGRTGGARSGLA